MRNALIVDVETTGLDPQTGVVAEVGVVLYSIPHHTTLAQFSRLLHGVELLCFGKNSNGSPKHPLYLRRDAELVRFR